MEHLGEYLREKRLKAGVTQKELAKAAGISEGAVSRWESGYIRNMTADRVLPICRLLDIDPYDLLSHAERLAKRRRREEEKKKKEEEKAEKEKKKNETT